MKRKKFRGGELLFVVLLALTLVFSSVNVYAEDAAAEQNEETVITDGDTEQITEEPENSEVEEETTESDATDVEVDGDKEVPVVSDDAVDESDVAADESDDAQIISETEEVEAAVLEAANTALSGSGTEADPYLIQNESDFEQINTLSDGTTEYYYKLMSDIDLSKVKTCGDFYGGKYYIENFKGVLDGNSHTISAGPETGYVIYMFCTGEIKSLTWNLHGANTLVCDTQYGDRNGSVRTFKDITVTGNADYGAKNNTAPILIYPSYNITMDNVVVKADISGEKYHAVFVGYGLYNYTNIVFKNCGFEGTAIGNWMGMFFGNSVNMENYMASNYRGSVDVTVEGCYNTGHIYGMTGDGARYLCAPIATFTEGSNMLAKEQEIMSQNTGLTADGLGIINAIGGYSTGKDGNYRVKVTDSNADVDHLVLSLSYYTQWYEDGELAGTMLHTITDSIPAKEGISTYYSTLKDLPAYDGDDGVLSTTGKEGAIKLITKDGQEYYYQKKDGHYAFSSLDTNTVSNNLTFNIYAYDAEGKILGKITEQDSDTFTMPDAGTYQEAVGQTIDKISLTGGYKWIDDSQKVVKGGQTFYAYKDDVILPVYVEGYEIPATKIVLDKSSLLLKLNDETDGTGTLSVKTLEPDTTTDNVTWTSEDESIATVTAEGVVTAVSAGQTKIIAQAGNVSADCTVTVYEVTEPEALPEIDTTVKEVTVGVDSSATEIVTDKLHDLVANVLEGKDTGSYISEDTKNAIADAVNNGETLRVEVIAENVDQADEKVAADVPHIEDYASSENMVVAQYLNLEVVIVNSQDNVIGNINQLNREVTFKVAIPEELRKSGRTFYIIRYHDGAAEVLPSEISEDGSVLSFKTDKFSTYALAYVDTDDQTDDPGNDPGNDPDNDPNKNPNKDPETNPDNGSGQKTNIGSDNKNQQSTNKSTKSNTTGSVKTGDTSHAMLWVVTMLICMAAIGTVFVMRKKFRR